MQDMSHNNLDNDRRQPIVNTGDPSSSLLLWKPLESNPEVSYETERWRGRKNDLWIRIDNNNNNPRPKNTVLVII